VWIKGLFLSFQCAPQCWFLSANFHFFILTPLIVFPIWKWKQSVWFIIPALLAASQAFIFLYATQNESFLKQADLWVFHLSHRHVKSRRESEMSIFNETDLFFFYFLVSQSLTIVLLAFMFNLIIWLHRGSLVWFLVIYSINARTLKWIGYVIMTVRTCNIN